MLPPAFIPSTRKASPASIPAAEIMAMGFDETDPHDQYVIVKDRDGAESTFRNSYVDIFIS